MSVSSLHVMVFQRYGNVEAIIVMQKQLPDTTITVPVPNHAELRIGTLQSIIRQSGVSRTEFEQ